MSSRTVAAIFDAENSRYIRKLLEMRQATAQFTRELSASSVKNRQDWDRVSGGMVKTGALMAGGLLAVTTAAIQWQSQFAGVAKTVGGTQESLSALDGQLRDLARTMSASHEEIARVAENAGQLGVRSQDIAQFTRTMIMLGESTNLSADQASTSLAQLMTIMGTAPGMVDRLGATLVDLGNNGASTEAQIVELSQRIAGASRAIGLNEAQVMGWSSAIASTGMNVEAGGTAMSKVFIKLDRLVQSNSEKLKTLNEVTGSDFAQAFKSDASGAVLTLVESLGTLQSQGGSVTKVLDEIGIRGVYETDVLRRLAGSGNLAASQLGIANKAMAQGTALLVEYQKRQETSAARVQVAWNNLKDAAIDAGSSLLPIVANGANEVAKWAQSWERLPGPVKSAAVQLAGAAAAGLLIVGGGMKIVGAVSNMVEAYSNLAATAPKAAAALKTIGIAALAITAATIALHAYGAALDEAAEKSMAKSSDIATGILSAFNEGRTYDLTFDIPVNVIPTIDDPMRALRITNTRDALRHAFAGDWGQGLTEGLQSMLTGTSATKQILSQLEKYDQGLADLAASGNAKAAAAGFQQIMQAAQDAKVPLEQVLPTFDNYRRQLDMIAEGLGLQGQITEDQFVKWMGGEVPAAVQRAMAYGGPLVSNLSDQQKALTGVATSATAAARSLQAYAAAALAVSGNELGVVQTFQAAFDPYKQGGMKKGGGFSLKSEAGQRNTQQTNDIAGQANSYIQSLKDAGADTDKLTTATEKWRGKLADAFVYGGKNRAEAEALAATYIAMPDEVAPTFSAPGLTVTKKDAEKLDEVLRNFPDVAETEVLAPGARPSKKQVDEFIGSIHGVPKETKAQIRTIAELGGIERAREELAKVRSKTIYINTLFRSGKISADGNLFVRSGHQLMRAFESGGFYKPTIGSQQPRIEQNRGPEGIQWAETGAGPWEAFVSGHPAKRDRSRDITSEVVGRLGGDVVWRNADGGIRDYQQYSRGAADRPQVVVQSTTYYPIAEPESVATNRVMQTAAAVGRFV